MIIENYIYSHDFSILESTYFMVLKYCWIETKKYSNFLEDCLEMKVSWLITHQRASINLFFCDIVVVSFKCAKLRKNKNDEYVP